MLILTILALLIMSLCVAISFKSLCGRIEELGRKIEYIGGGMSYKE